MNTNLVIVPTRSRPDNAERFSKYFFENSSISDLIFGIDDDQVEMYPKINGAMYDVNPNMKLVPKLNAIADKFKDKYETITFLGDDHVLRTEKWDEILYAPIKKNGYGFSYGNDLFQSAGLPTSTMVSTNIIKSLGFMACPSLYHMYIDNYWGMMGNELKALFYFENVIWEHLHWVNNKAPADASYQETNSYLQRDQIAYQEYLNKNFQNDLQKIKKELNLG